MAILRRVATFSVTQGRAEYGEHVVGSLKFSPLCVIDLSPSLIDCTLPTMSKETSAVKAGKMAELGISAEAPQGLDAEVILGIHAVLRLVVIGHCHVSQTSAC